MALVSSVRLASNARSADRSIGLGVAARCWAGGTCVDGTLAAPGGPAATPNQSSTSSVPGTRRLAVILGRVPQRRLDMAGRRHAQRGKVAVEGSTSGVALEGARGRQRTDRCRLRPTGGDGEQAAGFVGLQAEARKIEAEGAAERQPAGEMRRAAQQADRGVAQRQRLLRARNGAGHRGLADLAVDELRQADIVEHLPAIRQRGVEGEVEARLAGEVRDRSLDGDLAAQEISDRCRIQRQEIALHAGVAVDAAQRLAAVHQLGDLGLHAEHRHRLVGGGGAGGTASDNAAGATGAAAIGTTADGAAGSASGGI